MTLWVIVRWLKTCGHRIYVDHDKYSEFAILCGLQLLRTSGPQHSPGHRLSRSRHITLSPMPGYREHQVHTVNRNMVFPYSIFGTTYQPRIT
jgi:hypothetical protein